MVRRKKSPRLLRGLCYREFVCFNSFSSNNLPRIRYRHWVGCLRSVVQYVFVCVTSAVIKFVLRCKDENIFPLFPNFRMDFFIISQNPLN